MIKDSWIKKYYGTLLLGILFFSFITRIYQLHIPERYIFDEVYHAVTAKLIAKNDPRALSGGIHHQKKTQPSIGSTHRLQNILKR